MNETIFVKFLCSLPCIFLCSYFFPIMGVLLLLLRVIIYNKKILSTSFWLFFVCFCIYLPKILHFIFTFVSVDFYFIQFLDTIVENSIYTFSFLNFANLLFFIGIFLLLFIFLLKRILIKFESILFSYIQMSGKRDYEIHAKNDLFMKKKQERAKNRRVVYCKKCGADNIVTSNISTCKYCRSKIEVD